MASPEWKKKLNEAISENMKKDKDSISYPFSTIGPDGGPKTRFVLHRGFVNERRKEEDPSHNQIGAEEEGLVGEALLSTTDVRAPKSQQLGKDDKIEIAWWFAPSGDQFRITGHAYVYGRPDHPLSQLFLQHHAKRLAPPGNRDNFNWEDERKRIFDKISPPIRASFARPIPGTPLKASERNDGTDEDYNPNDWPEAVKPDDDKDLVAKCYNNFALTIIEPLAIDWCQLNEQPNKRAIWRKQETSGEWNKVEVCP